MTNEINLSKHNKYCSCCGREILSIKKELEKLKFENGIRKWKNHKQYEKDDFFYDYEPSQYCENCGIELHDDDFNGLYDDRGECHGTPCKEYVRNGYTCHKCNHTENF